MSATDYSCHHAHRSRALRPLIASALALGMANVLAQTPVISDADMARAARQQPQVTDADVARAAQRYRMPSDDELARVPVPAQVNLDALPTPMPGSQSAASGVNLADVARGYEAAQIAARTAALNTGSAGWDASMPSLVVFISFAMPSPTLERLVTQAQTVGATLVLRGLVNGSLRETAQRCQALIGQQRVAIQIDPQSFERFAVSQTPTFVLVKPGHAQATSYASHGAPSGSPDRATAAACATAACKDVAGFASVRGDVSIDYALRAIAERDPDFEPEARMLLHRFSRGRP